MRSKCVFLSGNAFKNALKENENNSRCDNKNLKNLRYEVNIKEKISEKSAENRTVYFYRSYKSGGIRMGIQENMDENFRGIIYIVQNGKVLYERESGFADLPNEIPNTIETKFASASAGKVFVAAGILQLIERGSIRFEDTLGKLLAMPLHEIDQDVTVKQLLNHTSGVPDYFDESVMDE